MKTIIIYTGKYGSTEMYAKRLAVSFGEESLAVDLKKSKGINLAEWDSVLLGGGIYMGKISRALKAFFKKNLKILMEKRIGLYLCCACKAEDPQISEYFEKNFPSELIEKAKVKKVFPGGQVMNEKGGFIYKKMYDDMKKIPEEQIQELVSDTVKSFSI